MSLTVGVLIGFAVLVVVVAVITNATRKQYTLESLPLLPGELVHFDDSDAAVSALGQNHAAHIAFVFRKAVVRLTDRRLIVSVGGLFQPSKKIVIYIAYHGGAPIPDSGGGSDMINGQLFRIDASNSHIETVNDSMQALKLRSDLNELKNSPLPPLYLLIASPRLMDYLPALGLASGRERTTNQGASNT